MSNLLGRPAHLQRRPASTRTRPCGRRPRTRATRAGRLTRTAIVRQG